MPQSPDLLARLTLVRPSLDLVPSYLDFIEEMRALDETIWPSRIPGAGEGPDAFVARLLLKETAPIEANGGLLDGIVFVDEVKRETCHYWIDVDGHRPSPRLRQSDVDLGAGIEGVEVSGAAAQRPRSR